MDKLVINGFFGKGNCGDEAILQYWFDTFSNKYKIVACVDGQVLENLDRSSKKLYGEIELINNNNVSFSTDHKTKALIIGGGGLGLGFGIRQLLHSRLRKKRNFYIGTTVHDEFFDGDKDYIEINRQIFNCFEDIYVRDKYSQNNLKTIFSIESNYIPDLAIGLESEEIEIKTSSKFITMTIRDFGSQNFESINKWLTKIESFASENNYEIIYLPFDKGDENLLKKINKKILYSNIFWEPKKVKFIISKSEYCFSIGRFHPLIFAISESVTPYFIDINNIYSEEKFNPKNRDKNFYLLQDNNLLDNYLINQDFESVQFSKSKNINEVSKNILEESARFKKQIQSKI